MSRYSLSDGLIPAGLIALAFIPVVGGIVRLAMLVGGAPATPESARFIAAPVPVVLHIIAVTIYCVVGAFQFSPGLRRNHPRWHRSAGRVLVPMGLVAALTGLWMAMTYAIIPADTPLLHGFRLLAGSGMAAFLVLGYAAIRRGDVETHQGWMRRAYAIGQGAGTQALAMLVVIMSFGPLDDTSRTLNMDGAWLFNLGVAE
ncbi:MAG: hypothetical protein JWQ89_3214 [Devosia sp.]|uniref:DUF2306 domain-containing protein n=1 Tax=Devosia sp. TaxID=1871048 RepID=UPI00263211EA|nr:DUF2306 domain-containing protein [Devosia sp.]MDB5541487.1 hypothetical protein [Devosia sp.]